MARTIGPSAAGSATPARPPAGREALRALLRTDPTAKRIAHAWRRLAKALDLDGARVLVAASGGADSTALALALTAHRADIHLAHIRHDLRPPHDTAKDIEALQRLATRLEAPLAITEIHVANLPGNTEANARHARYTALAQLARDHHCPLIATAHHADDQLETLLLALLRGAGPQGLSGIPESRSLTPNTTPAPSPSGRGHATRRDREVRDPLANPIPDQPVTPQRNQPLHLIRPMLEVTRTEAHQLCALTNTPCQDDPTNTDTTRARAHLRHHLLPTLLDRYPQAPRRAATTAKLMRDAQSLIDTETNKLLAQSTTTWPTAELATHPDIIITNLLRRAALLHTNGAHADALTDRLITPALTSIRAQPTIPTSHDWPADLQLQITATTTTLRTRAPS